MQITCLQDEFPLVNHVLLNSLLVLEEARKEDGPHVPLELAGLAEEKDIFVVGQVELPARLLVSLPAVLQPFAQLALGVLLLVLGLGDGVGVQAPLVVVAGPVHLVLQPVQLQADPGVLLLVLLTVRLFLLCSRDKKKISLSKFSQ